MKLVWTFPYARKMLQKTTDQVNNMHRDFSLPGRSPVLASEHAVATSHPLATTAALTILREGGNAIDAAICACVTQCVVEPHMTGIGGDCFALVGEANGKLHGLNGSGRSASGADLGWYLDNGFTHIAEPSPHSVTVPGAVNAWTVLHERFGSMDFARLFSDAIRYAEEGFPVSNRVAADWANNLDKLSKHEASARQLLLNGKIPSVGDRFFFPELAGTLRRIALEGKSAFYEGEVAEEIASTIQNLGGFLTAEDIGSVSAEWVEPISTAYRGHVLHELPPNGQGLAALILVRLLERTGIAGTADPVERAHLEAECGRIAYLARDAYISDPDHMQVSVESLLSDGHINALAEQFDPAGRNNNIGLPDPTGADTVYISVVDRDGMAVSFINSLFGNFGSGITTEKSGVVLHNRGSGFNLIEGHGNAIGPSKRPFHTIIPAMVTKDGMVSHSFGVMGGQYQAMGHAHVLSNMLDYGMDPQRALDDPRIFWSADGGLLLENGVSEEVQRGLEKLGHPCARGAVFGGGQIIQIDRVRGCLIAGSDPRKDGLASGF